MSEETTESTSTGGDGGSKKDVAAAIKDMGAAEKLVALGAAAFLLSFLVKSEYTWKSLFKFGSSVHIFAWWWTLGFLGSVGALVLIITKMMGVKLVDAKLAGRLVIICASAPAVGWAIDSISQNFWVLLMMLSTAVLGFAAWRMVASKD